MVTIFPNIKTTLTPRYIPLDVALDRIKSGRSKERCEQIRSCNSKDERGNLKGLLPCVVFTGKFTARNNDSCIEQTKLIILDFDNVIDLKTEKESLKATKFIYACWVSPSGTGLKALVKVATNDHTGHFLSLEKRFPQLDSAGKDIARVCYESYDPDLYLNLNSEVYTGIYKEPAKEVKIDTSTSDYKFGCLLTWLRNKGTSFIDGNRNNFVFRLAAACNRIGMSENDCIYNIGMIVSGTGFEDEANVSIRGVYKRYSKDFGSYALKENEVYDSKTNENVTNKIYDIEDFSEDIITFNSIWDEFLRSYRDGITKGDSTHIKELDEHFRWMKGQTNLLHGFGNFGKSTFFLQLAMLKSLYDGTVWGIFTPEQMPAVLFYRDLVQGLLGKTINNKLLNFISIDELENIKEFVHTHFVLIYPKKNKSTPEYIFDRLFDSIIKHKVGSCVIDPFNKLAHAWGNRDDHYLETQLAKYKTFTSQNDIYLTIMAHPTNPKSPDINYDMPTPDVWNLAGGAMWNNSMDNILVYHRPKHHIDKAATDCIFGSQKIRFQQMNGIPGYINMDYRRDKFRFYINGVSPLDSEFVRKKLEVKSEAIFNPLKPNTDFLDERDEIPF